MGNFVSDSERTESDFVLVEVSDCHWPALLNGLFFLWTVKELTRRHFSFSGPFRVLFPAVAGALPQGHHDLIRI